MKPILFATPRSGSTIIGRMIGKIAKDFWGYNDYLGEVFGIWTVNPTLMNKVNGKLEILYEQFQLDVSLYEEGQWKEEEIKRRVRLLEEDPLYMIKIFPEHYRDEMESWVKSNYTPIFLERRNKIEQLLSLMAMHTKHKATYGIRENDTVESIVYKSHLANDLLFHDNLLNEIKKKFPEAKTIYYEDWLELGANEQAVCRLLGCEELLNDVNMLDREIKPTPYIDNPENLILNKDEWLKDKPLIIEAIKNKAKNFK